MKKETFRWYRNPDSDITEYVRSDFLWVIHRNPAGLWELRRVLRNQYTGIIYGLHYVGAFLTLKDAKAVAG